MNERFSNARGFALLESAVAVAIIIILIIIGSITYSHYDKSNAGIILSRQQAIDKYVRNLSFENYTSLGTSLYDRGYVTSALYLSTESLINGYGSGSFSSSPAYSKLICVDEIPSSFSYGVVTVASNALTATLAVHVFVPSSLASTPYSADWVKVNGVWKLNDAQCA